MTSSHPHESTGWFELLYAAASGAAMPWDRTAPNPRLVSWATSRQGPVDGRAVVVGCGLGADIEFLASLGYSTLALDISSTAVELARSRFPDVFGVEVVRVEKLADPGDPSISRWRAELRRFSVA